MQALRQEVIDGALMVCREEMAQLDCQDVAYVGRDNAPVLERVLERPPELLDIRLDPTCNLRCVMCDIWPMERRNVLGALLTPENIGNFFPRLKAIRLLGGEPFLQRDAFEFIQRVRQINPGISWSFTTNASYRQIDRVIGTLEGLSLDKVTISLDSLRRDRYEAIRIGADFERVMGNLGRLEEYREARKASGRPFSLGISAAIMPETWREIPDFVRFCRQRRLGLFFLPVLKPLEHSLRREEKPIIEEALKMATLLSNIFPEAFTSLLAFLRKVHQEKSV
ncbi:MAG: radical SAM protein [Oligoflexia bacterium]|nr:radical SAM protein [Oligoflexia bacterium]